MGFYNDIVLPRLIDLAMRKEDLVGYRKRVIGAAQGQVLEIGIGSGLNLPFYGTQVTEIVGLDPSRRNDTVPLTRGYIAARENALNLMERRASMPP